MDEQLRSGLRALVDAHRLRIVARLATRPADAETLAAELRQPVPAIRRHLQTLVDAGLAEPRPDTPGAYRRPPRQGGGAGSAARGAGRGGGRAIVRTRGRVAARRRALDATLARLALHARGGEGPALLLVDGRLVSIPAQGRKRQVVLRYLLDRVFPEDREYPEKEVNQRLALFHPDVAALRRYLVDERLMTARPGSIAGREPMAADGAALRG